MPDDRFTMHDALDRYITGNYGEDQFKSVNCPTCGEELNYPDSIMCERCGWHEEADDDA